MNDAKFDSLVKLMEELDTDDLVDFLISSRHTVELRVQELSEGKGKRKGWDLTAVSVDNFPEEFRHLVRLVQAFSIRNRVPLWLLSTHRAYIEETHSHVPELTLYHYVLSKQVIEDMMHDFDFRFSPEGTVDIRLVRGPHRLPKGQQKLEAEK